MDFIDKVRELSVQIPRIKQQGLIKTEEGTKNALIMPFINALGYNVFDPTEVTPELIADVGTKKGEKVDYAILKDGKPIILFECKCCGTDLGQVQASQLFRYFSVTEARFGVLTDGVIYQFYTDLEAPNKMDTKPFLVIDMLDIKEPLIEELKKFTKTAFDVEQIISTASELKYTSAIKKIITAQLAQPTEDFVRFFASQVYSGRLTQTALAQFTEITKRAWREVIADRMKDTFTKAAEDATATKEEEIIVPPVEAVSSDKVVTTENELEAYHIVRAIVREVIDVKRVVLRDAQSYCAILIDDNNRKPICRFHFNGSKKYVGFFDEQKHEERVLIESIDELFNHANRLKTTVSGYIQAKTQ
ncbi:MAG TPA: type I restriction endonuclease [Phototrophicaceae bacterium]|nr:type I restriction endonuclease [Phototrophicaceae bacterium]